MVVVTDIVLFEDVLITKVMEDQVLHYVKYLTGSSTSSSSSSSRSNRSSGSHRHSLIQRRTNS